MMAETITLLRDDGCSVKIHLFGATVISWICCGTEQLFLSSLSKLDGSKAIRGGIPIVFPNFGPWSKGPQHGFARISWWKVKEKPQKMPNGSVVAVLQLNDNEETRKQWKHNFSLEYKVVLNEKDMETTLVIKNTGKTEFDFTTLLHTYIKVSDISQTKICGFEESVYVDKVAGISDNKETRKAISIKKNVDSVYKNAGNVSGHRILTPERTVVIEKSNMPDTVLWNPWKEKAIALSDFDDHGYLNMVCVEAGYVSERKVLMPGEDFICSQKLTVTSPSSL